jgi:hypothetical protein
LVPSLKAAVFTSVDLSFIPDASGTFEATYFIESNAQQTPRVEIHVKGKGVAPVSVDVTPKEIDFGSVVVNQAENRPLTVTNNDVSPFEIMTAEITAGSPEFVISTITGSLLEPGASTTFTVSYEPTQAGDNTGEVELQLRRVGSTDESITTVTVPLKGQATFPVWCTGAVTKPLCKCGPQTTCLPDGSCGAARRVFISKTMMNGDLQGVAHADEICNDYATKAELGGTWMAFIGDSSTSPSKHFTLAPVPYALLDGTIVARDGYSLISGSLMHGITLDECGSLIENAEVWTGLSSAGASSGSGCQDFTSASNNSDYAPVGLSGRTDSSWVNVYLQYCDRGNVRLYCIEQ